jgi:hypothetical protein
MVLIKSPILLDQLKVDIQKGGGFFCIFEPQ